MEPSIVLLDERLMLELTQLEETYATDPQFMERATHLLLVGCHQPRSSDELLTVERSNCQAGASAQAKLALLRRRVRRKE